MAEQAVKAVPIKSSDRLGFTMFVALVVHLVLVLGVVFEFELNDAAPLTDMEVIFIQNNAESKENDADYLAQVSQEGGGNVEQKTRPKAPPPSELPSDNPNPAPAQQVEMVSASDPKPVQEQLSELVDELAELKKQQVEEPEALKGLTAQQLIQRSKEIASLNAEVSQAWENYSKTPRKKFIHAATKEYTAAAYMTAWQEKVEHIGNINYPDVARRQGIYGNLIMEVDIRPDGSVQEIKVLRSSGKRVLDDAAIRIVRLAAPFAPFPPELKKETDVLAIIRTWQFQSGGLATQ